MTLRFHAPRFSTRLATPLLGLLAAMTLGLSGCDNPACVFGGGCRDEDSGTGSGDDNSLGGTTGALPSTGSFLQPGAPEFVGAAPSGDAATIAHGQTPIFVEFSESLNPATLLDVSDPSNPVNAFELIATVSGMEVPLLPPQLVGDGRVVVLLPAVDYPELQNYQLFFRREDGAQNIADLNGQLLGTDFTDPIVDFTVDSANAGVPRVIYSFPGDGAINVADTSEVVIGFDRSMDATTIDSDSFAVTVDGTVPAFDPEPEAVPFVSAAGMTPATQIFTWTPIDDGVLQPYGLEVELAVLLSDTPDEIVSTDGETLPTTETSFFTSDLRMPQTVVKTSGSPPEGGFNSADVFGMEFIVDVTMSDVAPAGTEAEIYLFGQSPQDTLVTRTNVETVAVPAGVTEFSLSSVDLGLIDENGDSRFADGQAQVAVVLLNGFARTAGARFDADPSTDEIESLVLDTTPPELLGLGATGDATDSFFGDVRDFAAFGRASEPIAFAFVDANGMTNGGSLTDPPATAFSIPAPDGSQAFFIATAVPVGVLDPNAAPLDYEITIFDEVFNSATATVTGTFSQRGVVGPGGAPTGSTVNVRVFNAVTLEPIDNALVLSYQEVSGGVTFVDDALTLGGAATVNGAGTGSTIITVDAEGFDLFSFQGIPRDAVDILLQPTLIEASEVEGRVIGDITGGLSQSDRIVQDTRTELPQRFFETGSCGVLGTTGIQCLFDELPVRPGRLGAISVLGVNPNLDLSPLNAFLFLTNFALGAPFGPLEQGDTVTGVTVDAGAGLAAGSGEDVGQFFAATAFTLGGVAGLGALDDDPTVTVEGVATGLVGGLLIGAGQSEASGAPGTFGVVAAVAGAARPSGPLEVSGALSPESFMRMSAIDVDSNETVARLRFSNIGAVTVPLDIPAINNPVVGSMTGGQAYNIQVADVLPDSAGLSFGLYRVQLTDTLGRGWTLVGLDASDSAGGTIVLSVQDIAAQGGNGLQNGQITASVEVFAQNLDRGQFLWTDLEREHEFYSRAAPITFTQN